MRNIKIILFIFTFALLISGCSNVNKTSADEVVTASWSTENLNGIRAELNFDINTNTAKVTIFENKSTFVIQGVFSIDNDELVIISESLKNSYHFAYKVFENRLELTYMNENLIFEKNKPQ